MQRLPYIKFLRWGAIAFFIISLLTGILSGTFHFVKTGDPKPLADNTMGLLLNADTQAYNLEKDMRDGKFEAVPEEYRQLVKDAALRTILSNLVFMFLVLLGLYKVVEFFFEWQSPNGTKFLVIEILFTILIYCLLGILYNLFNTIISGDPVISNFYGIVISGIPFKSIWLGAKLLFSWASSLTILS